MPQYMMHVFCSECSVPHASGIVIDSKDEVDPTQSMADIYDGRDLPPQIAMFINNSFHCPATGKFYRQRDNGDVFLVKMKEL